MRAARIAGRTVGRMWMERRGEWADYRAPPPPPPRGQFSSQPQKSLGAFASSLSLSPSLFSPSPLSTRCQDTVGFGSTVFRSGSCIHLCCRLSLETLLLGRSRSRCS
ncbi:hypothetical protein SKAU_G00180160 [Synaphobranchus kaupii]|uniref:Uncharacterized protein n=1 Tax=Synaphobranchus kaupii TaxID=118154 RepID=A0A9Q1FM88_SYNKA|nr:hypothetical protein SKAU_G00180160 [Synaphobranchus kaupii]